MNHFQAVHYRDPQGFGPVRDFVDALPEQIQAAADLDLFLDVLYAPLTQRWLTRSGPLDDDFADALVHSALRAFGPI